MSVPAKRNGVAGIVVVVAVCCLMANGYFNARPGSFCRALVRDLRDPAKSFRTIEDIDRLYSGMPANENAFVAFKNFSIGDEGMVERIYYRSCYAAYPRRIFAGDSATVINHGRDILQSQFVPNDDWLSEHKVARLVIYEQHPDGRITAAVVGRDVQ